MIEILKASAGSGKTFNLARKYMAQLFVENVSLPYGQWRPNPDPTAYRHVLAVTFTNKATEEMKSRILDELHLLSTEPEKSAHYDFFLQHPFNGNRTELKNKAGAVLRGILHDYGAFAVSTIDRFFQLALKSFSKEIGHFASYQVELDKPSLVRESVDRVLDSLSPDESSGKLLDWLTDNAITQIQDGGKYSLESALLGVAMRQMTEEHRYKIEKYAIDEESLYTDERIKKLKDACSAVISGYPAGLKRASAAVRECLRNAGIDPADTSRSFMEKALLKIEAIRSGDEIPALPGLLRQDCDQWFAKKNAGLASRVDAALISAVAALVSLYDAGLKEYNTALLLRGQVYGLGVAACLRKAFDDLVKEKNVLDLDNCNTLLKGIIDGTDAPFIYEKMGVRYEHFLLDEFQDTSRVQWDNFLPLLMNSISQGFYNLVVGDVKQSIYRWRNSDWELLGHEVEEAFPDAALEPMKYNWRSSQTVVDFNNRFFEKAASVIGAGKIYADVKQEMKSDEKQKGSVQVTFTDDQMEAVAESVKSARAAGARWSDIAILVRKNSDGSAVAEELIGRNFPVISDDSLAVKSSAVVRRLVSLLSSIENPDNTVGSYLARQLGVEFPDRYHSLVDMCEKLLRSLRDYDPSSFEGETLFIQAFMDGLREWVDVNGNNLRAFLKHWADADPYIGSPEDSDSIRILTIHKSKGLEFPYVIFPFAESVGFFRETTEWCHLDAEGSPFGSVVTGNYPVSLTAGATRKTLFAKDLEREEFLQKVDNINVFYVALTRAGKCLHVISKTPSKKFREAYSRDKEEYARFSEILYAFCGGLDNQFYGEPYDFSKMEREPKKIVEDFPATYPSFSLDGRLSPSEDAADYFGADGVAGPAASARLSGIELHKALEGVRSPEDLPADLDSESRAFLTGRILAHPEWFSSGDVRDEVTIFGTDGREHRPDRVIFNGTEVFVLDYKFGTERRESYIWQVRSYMKLYRQLGFKTRGAVWYVADDEVVVI